MTTDIPEAWWRLACEVIPHGLGCVDLDNRFLWVNHEYCRLVGWSQAELIGRTWMSITADDDVGGDLKSVENLKDDHDSRSSYTLHKRYKHRDGHLVPVSLYVHTFTEAGTIKLFVACAEATMSSAEFVRDVEKRMHRELESLRLDLDQIQKERAFKAAVIHWIKDNWKIIAGVITLAATAVWAIAKNK